MLNDDLKNREYENAELQAQTDLNQAELQKCQDTIIYLKARYVDHARDPGKDNFVMIIEKIPPLRKTSFMSIPTILRGYRGGLLPQKDDGLGHSIRIICS